MLKDITLGQYFPGNTIVHRLDPRTKLILVTVYLVALFTANTLFALGLVAVYLGMIIVVSKTKMRLLIKGLKPLIIILTVTGLLNVFFTPGEPIFTLWRLVVTWDGVSRGVILVLRVVMMVMGTSILTYTTPPMALTDGLESLMKPLKRIRIPVHELAMIMSITLRFIPALIEETDKIMNAQKARGADFETGNIIRRARAMLPLLIPLFMSAFRRAEELAIAMESRCYHGGVGRTRMRALKFARCDVIAGLVAAGLFGAVMGLVVIGL